MGWKRKQNEQKYLKHLLETSGGGYPTPVYKNKEGRLVRLYTNKNYTKYLKKHYNKKFRKDESSFKGSLYKKISHNAKYDSW